MRLIHLLPLLLTRFRKEALLFWRVVTHRATPLPAKLLALLAVLCVILPVDLIPDFIPILGWLDEIGAAAFMLSIAYRFLLPQRYAPLRAGVCGGTASATTSGTGVKREPVIIDVTPEK